MQAYQNDGTLLAAQFPVTWQLPAPEVFNQVGNVKIEGIADVLGEKLPVTAMVRIAKKTVTLGPNVAPVAVHR
ncbi:hypothetical protein [Ligilactobacillus apodemi]|uniref:hypothetical protein n=1 Tax=Ligilactobacillus apodemi TaxID=307126 RepID=UPI001F417AB1|nr:hypothetical protein [Ligilactobacillus apodemi]